MAEEANLTSNKSFSSKKKNKISIKTRVQKLGTALSGMIMPNIGVIIAWGLISAFFLTPGGWFPNAKIYKLAGPMLTYLIPLLIGFSGGRLVYKERGAIVGVIATIGIVVGSNIPMFLGGMIMGPLGGWCIKKFDQYFRNKIRTGFEMIYDNFSAGIMGMLLAIMAEFIAQPLVTGGNNIIAAGVKWIMSVDMLPLANLFIEPAKVLFLNNAVGNGILVPLGIQTAADAGKSVLFLLEANPGPGLGLLLAYTFFGKGQAKSSAGGAAIIHFFGGVHEIYFPYILMKPILVIPVMLAGVAGTFTFQLFNVGLKAAASPGSIISVLLMTARDSYVGVIVGVTVAALVSFAISAVILKTSKSTSNNLGQKKAQMQQMKAQSSGKSVANSANDSANPATGTQGYENVRKVVFACDAGMGSSAMGASIMRNKMKKAGVKGLAITNTSISNLQNENGTLIITQGQLAERAAQKTPRAMHVSVGNLINSPRYDNIVSNFKQLTKNKTQTQENKNKSNQQKTQTKTKSIAVNFDQIKEVDFIDDSKHLGSITMSLSLFKGQMKKLNKKIIIKRLSTKQIVNQADHLLISTPTVVQKVKQKYPKVQILIIKNLVSQTELKSLAEKLH